MNLQLVKPLLVKPNAEEKYLPDNVNTKTWYSVIGFEYYRKKFIDKKDNGKEKWTSVVNFLIVNDKQKLTFIASFNCDVIEDHEKPESKES